MTQPQRILLAEHSSPWRTHLADALQSYGIEVELSETGEDVRAALCGGRPELTAVVLGDLLRQTSGPDALFLAGAALSREGRARESWPITRVLMITDVRSDLDLLEHYRRRGVSGFIRRDDPLEAVVTQITNTLFAQERSEPRYAVRLNATLAFEDLEQRGTIEDLSLTGARLVTPRQDLDSRVIPGSRFHLGFGFEGAMVKAAARVRNVQVRNTFFGDRLVVGCSFEDLPEEARRVLSRVMVFAARELEMAARG